MQRKTVGRVVIVTAIVAVAALGLAVAVGLLWGPLAGGRPWGAGGRGFGRARSIDERQGIDAAGLQRLTIEAVSEEVRIRYGDGPQVAVRLHGVVRAADPKRAPSLAVSREAGAARVAVDHGGLLPVGWYLGDLALEVELPRAYRGALAARSVSGAVQAGDLSLAEVSLASTSGEILAGRLRAEAVRLLTVSGDIRAQAASARQVEVGTTSGGALVEGLAGEVAGRSVSGDLELVFNGDPGEVEVESTSGDVVLRLPAGAGFRLQARSTSGRLDCRLPIRLEDYASDPGRNTLAGTVGAGGAGTVRVRTVSGDIRIE